MEEQARIAAETNNRLGRVAAAESSLTSALRGIEEQVTTVIEAAVTGQLGVEAEAVGSAEGGSARKQVKTEIETLAQVSIPDSWAWSTVGEVGEAKLGKAREPKREQGEYLTP